MIVRNTRGRVDLVFLYLRVSPEDDCGSKKARKYVPLYIHDSFTLERESRSAIDIIPNFQDSGG